MARLNPKFHKTAEKLKVSLWHHGFKFLFNTVIGIAENDHGGYPSLQLPLLENVLDVQTDVLLGRLKQLRHLI